MKLSVNEAKLTGLRCRLQALMGGGGGVEGGGGEAVFKKICFQPFWPQFGLKIKWRGRGAVGPPGSATGFLSSQLGTVLLFNKF